MTRYELIKQHEPCLDELARHGLTVRDLYRAHIYEEWLQLKAKGYKLTYCYMKIAETHRLGERTIYAIVAEMEQNEPLAPHLQ